MSKDYWDKRFEDLTNAQLDKGEAYYKTLETEYEKAKASIQKDIDAFYARFAKNNEMTLADARKVLTKGELKEFKWTTEEYIRKGRENAVDQRWMKELENASIKYRVSRLESIQLQLQQHVELLAAKQQRGLKDLLGQKVYEDGYYRTAFEVHKGLGMGTSFSKLDTRQIDTVLSKPWSPDGANFSSRIWKHRDQLVQELQKGLTQNLIRGDGPDKFIAQLAKKFNVSKSVARRLVLTETAYFAEAAKAESFRELGIEKYRFVATIDKKTSAVCRDMHNQIFPLEERKPGVNAPPLHAHCRSTTVPEITPEMESQSSKPTTKTDAGADSVDVSSAMPKTAETAKPIDIQVASRTAEPVIPDIEVPKTMDFEDWKEKALKHNHIKLDLPTEEKHMITDADIERVPYVEIPGFTKFQNDKLWANHKEILRLAKEENDSNEVLKVSFTDYKMEAVQYGSERGVSPQMGDTVHALIGQNEETGKFIFAHNHPRNSSFSLGDIINFVRYDYIVLMTIVTNQGMIYTIRKTELYDRKNAMFKLKSVYDAYNGNAGMDTATSSRAAYFFLLLVAEMGVEYGREESVGL